MISLAALGDSTASDRVPEFQRVPARSSSMDSRSSPRYSVSPAGSKFDSPAQLKAREEIPADLVLERRLKLEAAARAEAEARSLHIAETERRARMRAQSIHHVTAASSAARFLANRAHNKLGDTRHTDGSQSTPDIRSLSPTHTTDDPTSPHKHHHHHHHSSHHSHHHEEVSSSNHQKHEHQHHSVSEIVVVAEGTAANNYEHSHKAAGLDALVSSSHVVEANASTGSVQRATETVVTTIKTTSSSVGVDGESTHKPHHHHHHHTEESNPQHQHHQHHHHHSKGLFTEEELDLQSLLGSVLKRRAAAADIDYPTFFRAGHALALPPPASSYPAHTSISDIGTRLPNLSEEPKHIKVAIISHS